MSKATGNVSIATEQSEVERLVDDDGDGAAEHDVQSGGGRALAADPLVAGEDLEPDGGVERLAMVVSSQ